ncbi:MAG: vanadium-dependent haloperoxidase [Caldilineaceae bacterium]|nr:vanadium-dependent haloperoxidase [Caldilineaceae bacterium]
MEEAKSVILGRGPQLRRKFSQQILVVALLLVIAQITAACAPVSLSRATADYDAGVATEWFDLSLQLVQETNGFTPPVASRALGYLGVTLYETVRPGMFGYRSMQGQLNELEGLPTTRWFVSYHWPSAANAALADLSRKLFATASPENLSAIEMLEEKYAQQFMVEVDTMTYQRSVQWGRSMASAIYAWSLEDGGHEAYTRNFPKDYAPPTGAGMWISTPPNYATAMQPYWGDNRSFVLRDGAECPAPPPPAYSQEPDSAFYAEAMEVYEAVKLDDPEHKAIALFWADDPGSTSTPPGHWVAILSQVISAEDASLALTAEGYAKLGIAVADSFIVCWHTKFVYNVMRPISYIQAHIDPSWNIPDLTDPVTTPPFPEYTSGHSVQSAAAAVVLTDLFGDNYAFTDNTHEASGLPARSFASFSEAADEAGISRLYGGIHYRSAIENGLAQGICVADHVLGLTFNSR